MKAMVRDDIVSLNTYVEAEFKYKKYLELLDGCGGYCFLDQFERLLSHEGGKYLARKMEEAGLIKSEYFSNHKYIRLTSGALKYLYYRYDNRDYSNVSKNRITVKNLSAKPSEKTLFTSTIYFEMAMRGAEPLNTGFVKNTHLKHLEQNFKTDNKSKISDLNQELKQIKKMYEFIIFSQENAVETYNSINSANDRLKVLIESLERKKTDMNNAKVLKNNKEIIVLSEYIEALKNTIAINTKGVRPLVNIQKSKDDALQRIRDIEMEIIKLNEEESVNSKADKVIDKIIQIRDISKIICYYVKKNNALCFVSVLTSNSKTNYDKIINSIIELLQGELDLNIYNVYLDIYSIEDNENKINGLISKLEKKLIKGFWKDGRNVNIEYNFDYETLEKLQKYFGKVSNSINYIKDSDVDTFKRLQEKLTPKK